MDGMELEKQIEEIAETGGNSRFNQLIALSVAVVAVFMAMAKVKDDNIVQGMQAAQAHEVDLWNQYQAKSLKEVTFERQIDHWQLVLATGGAPVGREQVEAKISEWKKEVARYLTDKSDIKNQAEESRKNYDALNYIDDQFDMCDALMGLGVALFAMCSLTQNRKLYLFACFVALYGMAMGIAGFMGWEFHPGFIKYLS